MWRSNHVLACGAAITFAAALRAQVCTLSRESLDASGAEITSTTSFSDLSSDGRVVAFITKAQLVAQDTNQRWDLYARDTTTGALELVSAGASGAASNGDSDLPPDLSDDGRFVCFSSRATNLGAPVSGLGVRVFVRDRLLGQTEMASISPGGIQGQSGVYSAISGDGRYVVFATSTSLAPSVDSNGIWDVYLRDRALGQTKLVSLGVTGTAGNGASGDIVGRVDVSRDGRYVVFASVATDLLGDQANDAAFAYYSVYRRDRAAGVTELVSSAGPPANEHSWDPQCSEDGRYVVFMSRASNLVGGDTNGVQDLFVRDMALAGSITRVNVDSAGAQANSFPYDAAISPDGRFVAFDTPASNLVTGDTNNALDVFLRDLVTLRTERISLTSAGAQAALDSARPHVSRDGGVVAFLSGAPLVAGDNNAVTDLYARRCPVPTVYCSAKTNSLGCVPSLEATGVPLASWPRDFHLGARDVLNRTVGMLVYSTTGAAAIPFGGGTLCLQPLIRRTPPQQSGGSPAGSDCTGRYTFDFNAWIASGINPALIAGVSVWAQYWSRDPGFAAPDNLGLTDAVAFVIWP